jgi:hypothetical protein
MATMSIQPGIVGIRKILADNRKGWHVHNITTESYVGYYDMTVSELRSHLMNEGYQWYRIIDFMGNGIVIKML